MTLENGWPSRRFLGALDLETALARGIALAGADGVRYTRRQLYYAVCRALLPPECVIRTSAWMLGAVGAGLLALRGASPGWTGLTGSAVGLSAPRLVHALPFTLKPPLSESAFEQALAAYRARHGDPPGLLPDAPPSPCAPYGREPDLYDYGMALALVCQDSALARMLRANLLHMELACAILSLEEASPLPDTLAAMLMRAPAPRVLLLHDASPEGLHLVATAEQMLDSAARAAPSRTGAAPTTRAAYAPLCHAPTRRSGDIACIAELGRTRLAAGRLSGGIGRAASRSPAAQDPADRTTGAAPGSMADAAPPVACYRLYELA